MVTFIRAENSRLFIRAGDDWRKARVGFIFKDTSYEPTDPMTLRQIWGLGALLNFHSLEAQSPDELKSLADRIWTNLMRGQGEARVAWINGTGYYKSGSVLEVDEDGETIRGGRNIEFDNGHFSLNIGGGSKLTLSGDDVVIIDPPGSRNRLTVKQGGGGEDYIYLSSENSSDHADLRIISNGNEPGLLNFFVDADQNTLDLLGCDLRYFEVRKGRGTRHRVTSIGGPVFRLNSDQRIGLKARIDPLQLFIEDGGKNRSYMEFRSSPSHPIIGAIPTNFLTARGYMIGLEPMGPSARLHFQKNVLFYDSKKPDKIIKKSAYVVPDGSFYFHVADADEKDHEFITGTSATEFVSMRPRSNNYHGDIVKFHAGSPAMDKDSVAAVDPQSIALLSVGNDEPDFLNFAQTSWIGFEGLDQDAKFSAQSEDFNRNSPITSKALGLSHGPLAMRFARQKMAGSYFAMPILPLRGVTGNEKLKRRVLERERRAISKKRREVVSQANQSKFFHLSETLARESSSVYSDFTPQGFTVEIDRRTDRWRKLKVATSAGGANFDFSVEIENPMMEDVLARDRAFVVMTRPGDIPGKPWVKVNGDITIGEWGFNFAFDPEFSVRETKNVDIHDNITELRMPVALADTDESAKLPPPVFIFKYHDKSVQDLLKDGDAWIAKNVLIGTQWRDIRDNLEKLLDQARKIVEQIPTHPQADLYRPFYSRMVDPTWNGVLVVNLAVKLSLLPVQIKGLLGGMNLDAFRVHHVGVDINEMDEKEVSRGKNEPGEGKLFALIDYDGGDMPAKSGDPAYHFHVRYLRLLFESSEIQRFDCRVQLLINELFEDKAKLNQKALLTSGSAEVVNSGDRNILNFDGRYESRFQDGRKIEAYTFIHMARYEFDMDTFVFKKIVIERLQFVTVGSDDIPGDKSRTRTRFSFWGEIEFGNIGGDGMDLIAFEKLVFADLGIDMEFEFPLPSGMKFPELKFGFNPGALRFDIDTSNLRETSNFLRDFPLKFKFFQFAAGEGARIRLPDIGYMGLAFGGGGGEERRVEFKYGLGFDLSLGSLGKLGKLLKDFKVSMLFGWVPGAGNADPRIAVGFKLGGNAGGNLDIELQGVIRLVVGDYKIGLNNSDKDNSFYFLELKECFLEVLGRRIPGDEGKFSLFIFLSESLISEGLDPAKVGWFMGITDTELAPAIKIPYLGMGQRVMLDPGSAPRQSTKIYVDKMVALGKIKSSAALASAIKKPKNDPARLIYDPSKDWAIGLRADLYKIVKFDLVFVDDAVYGARLEILLDPMGTLAIDILYRKISDEIGVYALEILLPEAWRHLDFAAFSITLPAIGFEIYTNGDYLVDLGYPWNLDFSRSATVEILPFTGGGGFYYGQVTGEATDLIPEPVNQRYVYDPVLRVGLMARVGLGKEVRAGIFRAGLAATVFGGLEGALGRLRDTGGQGDEEKRLPRTYFYMKGVVGVLGELNGYVDFGMTKANVQIRIWVQTGLIAETFKAMILFIEAGVVVRIRFVIGRIKIFGKKIEIKITLSFSTTLRYDWPIGSDRDRFLFQGGFAATAFLEARQELLSHLPGLDDSIAWDPNFQVDPQGAKQPVALIFALDITVDREHINVPAEAIPLLTIEGGRDAASPAGQRAFDRMAKGLAVWAVRSVFVGTKLERSAATDPRDWVLTVAEVEYLARKLQDPVALSRWSKSGTPLNYENIQTFFTKNFEFTVSIVEDLETGGDSSISMAYFPVIPDLWLKIGGQEPGSQPRVIGTHEFWNKDKFGKAYQVKLDEFFNQILVELEERGSPHDLLNTGIDANVTLVQIMFEDYMAFVMKAVVDEWVRLLATQEKDNAKPRELLSWMAENAAMLGVTAADADKEVPWDRIAGQAGRFFLHGLRVPKDATSNDTRAVFKRSGLQFPLFDTPDGVPMDPNMTINVTLGINSGSNVGTWLTVDAADPALEVDVSQLQGYQENAKDYAFTKPDIIEIDPVESRPQLHPIEDNLTIDGEGGRFEFWPFPRDFVVIRRSGGANNAVHIRRIDYGNEKSIDKAPVIDRVWSTRVDLVVKQIFQGSDSASAVASAVPNAYLLGGMNEENRIYLDDLIAAEDSIDFSSVKVSLMYQNKNGSLAQVSSAVPAKVLIVRTNLSEQTRPFSRGIGFMNEFERPVAAEIKQKRNFLALIRECSIVNSGGYILFVRGPKGEGLPPHLFEPQVGSKDRPETATRDGARLSLLLEFTAAGEIPPRYVNGFTTTPCLDLQSTEGLAADVGLSMINVKSSPGTMRFEVTRKSPERLIADPRVMRAGGQPNGRREEVTAVVTDEILRAGSYSSSNIKTLPTVELNTLNDQVYENMLNLGLRNEDLESTFGLLEYGLKGNDYDDLKLDRSLPIGPTEERDGGETADGQAPDVWRYELSLPVYKLIHIDDEELKERDRTRYEAIGKEFELSIGVRDVYGNRDRNVLGKITKTPKYFDTLLSVNDLPGLGASFEAGQNNTIIKLKLDFDARAFYVDPSKEINDPLPTLPQNPTQEQEQQFRANEEKGEQRAKTALKTYWSFLTQFIDPNTKYGLACSLAADDSPVLISTDSELEAFKAFIVSIIDYLEQWPDQGAPTQTEWSKEFVLSGTAKGDFIPIQVWFAIDRKKCFVHRSAENFMDVYRVRTPIVPDMGKQQQNIEAFAKRFEKTFSDWKLATGVRDDDSRALWAVNRRLLKISALPAAGVPAKLEPTPFAIPPLSRELSSGEFNIRDYKGDSAKDKHETVAYREVDADLDLLARNFLRQVEMVLAPEVVAVAHNANPTAMEAIIGDHKPFFATYFADQLLPVFKDEHTPQPDNLGDARLEMRDRLKQSLNGAYDFDTVVTYALKVDKSLTFERREAPTLYGKMITETIAVANEGPRFAMSDVAIELRKQSEQPTLVFLLDAKRETEQANVNLLDLKVSISHIERFGAAGGPEMRSSAWLKFVLMEDIEVKLGSAQVPIPIRQFPNPPTLLRHGMFEDRPSNWHVGDPIHQRRSWKYEVDFDRDFVEQDIIYPTIRYNIKDPSIVSFFDDGNEPLTPLGTLVNFRENFDKHWEHVQKLVGGLAPSPGAEVALHHLEQDIKLVREAFERGVNPALAELEEGLDALKLQENLTNDDDLKLVLCRINNMLPGNPATVARDFSVFALNEDGTPVDPSMVPHESRGCKHVRYSDARHLADGVVRRRLVLTGLDPLRQENAWADVSLTRNEELVEHKKSRDKFIYRTPIVRFGDKITAYIEIPESLPVAPPRDKSLQGWIVAAIAQVFEGINYSVQCELRVAYDSGLLRKEVFSEFGLGGFSPLPIGMLPSTRFDLGSSGDGWVLEEVAASVEAVIIDWMTNLKPAQENGHTIGIYVFDIRVYSSLTSRKKPVLRFKRLEFQLSDINDLDSIIETQTDISG